MAHRKVSPQEAHDLMRSESYIYVDVRTEAEFAADRPEGAVNIPVAVQQPGMGMAANEDFLDVVIGNFELDSRIIVGCKAGGRSDRAAQILDSAGFANVVDQQAGFEGSRDANGAIAEPGWKPTGLPTENGEPDSTGYKTLATNAGK